MFGYIMLYMACLQSHMAWTLSGGFQMTPSIKGHEGRGLYIDFEAFNEPSEALYTALEITLHVAQIPCVI